MNCDHCNKETSIKECADFAGEIICNECLSKIHHNPTPEERYHLELQKFREQHIPSRYNQVYLLDELTNPDIDHFISISNRTDGKSFNYLHALLHICITFDLGLMLLTRNMMLRTSYQDLLTEVIDMSAIYDRKDFNFIRSQYYVALNYKDRTIAAISSLNDATELKNYSAFLRKFPIIVYDEFLALEDDYLADEWNRLKTIYQSIDRMEEYPLIHKPKILYLGNAVNFESPILHGLKIFNILENHPINTHKIYHYEFNVMLEINRNDNANEQRNTRAFGTTDDAMTTARFEVNDFNIATDADRQAVKQNPRVIYVKLKSDYLKIWFNPKKMLIILSVESRTDEPYQYNMQLKDNKEDSIYLKERYFDERHIKKIDAGMYLFENNFSKNYITSEFKDLNLLRIDKLIREVMREDSPEVEQESKERQFRENYIEQTKRSLMKKLWE